MTVLFAKFYNEFLGMLSITWNWVRIQRELLLVQLLHFLILACTEMLT
jgi:hypothetical protein